MTDLTAVLMMLSNEGEAEEALRQLTRIDEEDCAALAEAFSQLPTMAAVSTLDAYIEHRLPCLIPLLEALLLAPNPLLGDYAARYLGALGPDAAHILLGALTKAHVIVQMQILIALENVADSSTVPNLLAMLEATEEATLRYSLIQILGKIGDPRAIEPIKQYANDPNHHVRERVQIALTRLDPT